ncbi:erythroid differentiation-related factor 1 isoform X2 [Rhodnius prolixus]
MFAPLRYNTDLKLPPSNWLSSHADSYGLNYALSHSSGFSSFRMAHTFPDCVGEVDVVSDAENIKKLLKIPYSTNTVSMMVHRVENTLLIDEFDIHKHLLSRAESDWAWLRKFFFEHILQTLSHKDKYLSYREKSRYALQQKSLVSKFLHYSLAEAEESNKQSCENVYRSTGLPLTTRDTAVLPEPQLEEGLPGWSDHKFTRNVVWTFEDIQMLLGTDMPIFGGPTRPCISLRLRDAKKPISVLTGIDYWLDNLMSNVPEVVMCYHLDGIVQKYELIKTEDLPHLPDAKFSPKLIRDVAQNILSFLKSNATKAGHTYWLFKGTNDDAVKLYDLTSLCSDSLEEKGQNPFTVPVGMLLYRVARNMKASGDASQAATIRILLKNCLSLLDKEKYPQIVTSAHYMLSDVYVPSETDPSAPELQVLPQNDGQSDQGTMYDDCEEGISEVPVTDLVSTYSHSESKYNQPPPMTDCLEERCKLALQHAGEGINGLQYFDLQDKPNEKETRSEEEPKMAKPFEAIPMPYEKLDPGNKKEAEKGKRKKKKNNEIKRENRDTSPDVDGESENKSLKALLCKPDSGTLPTWQKPEKVDNKSWKAHLCSLLTKKACLVYSVLIEKEIDNAQYRLALKHIQGVLRCCDQNKALVGLMLSRAGDCFYNLSLDKTCPDEIIQEEDMFPVLQNPDSTNYEEELSLISGEVKGEEQLLLTSISCYQRSMELCPCIDTQRRVGNVYNRLSSFYASRAQVLLQNGNEYLEEEFSKYTLEAERLLNLGLKHFESVHDISNSALLLCNLGHLFRLKAHAPNSQAVEPLSTQQRQNYTKAIDSYMRALACLGSRNSSQQIWDVVNWELSTTLYSFATVTQDCPPYPTGSKKMEDTEREVAELLMKALKYCDITTPTHRLPLYQYRAAKLHHRLASLYHKLYREQHQEESKLRSSLQLSQLYYSKATSLFTLLDHPAETLRVQLERISLAEYIALGAKSPKAKMKNYQTALSYAVKCLPVLTNILQSTIEAKENEEALEKEEETEKEHLIKMLEDRLQFILKSLVKICTTADKNSPMLPVLKKGYESLLKKDPNKPLASHLMSILEYISSNVEGIQ